jgi:hypothetical protein
VFKNSRNSGAQSSTTTPEQQTQVSSVPCSHSQAENQCGQWCWMCAGSIHTLGAYVYFFKQKIFRFGARLGVVQFASPSE